MAYDVSRGTVYAAGMPTPRELRQRFADVVNVKDCGATGNGVKLDTAAINLAITKAAAGNGTVFFPPGTYLHEGIVTNTSVVLQGAGWRATILKNVHATNAGLTINSQPGAPYLVGGVVVRDMMLSAAPGTTGPGIAYNTQTHALLENVYLLDIGGHGVLLGVNQHVYGLTMSHVIIQNAGACGVYGRGHNDTQVNAINIINGTEIAGCGSHGVSVWGVNVNTRDSIIEGNLGYGVHICTSDSVGVDDNTAVNTSIDGNYLEANKLGNIYVEAGSYAGDTLTKRIQGLAITNNYLNGVAMNATAYNVKMVEAGTGVIYGDLNPALVGLKYDNNIVFEDFTVYPAEVPPTHVLSDICDFGDLPGLNCTISPGELHGMDRWGETGTSEVEDRYINIGLASLQSHGKRIAIPGVFFAKGDITYTSLTTGEADGFVPSGTPKFAYFPIPVPQGAVILDAHVHVTTVCADYSIEIAIFSRDPRGPAGTWTALVTWNAPNLSGTQLVTMPSIDSFVLSPYSRRMHKTAEDLMLRIKVTGTGADNLYLGNPFVRYN